MSHERERERECRERERWWVGRERICVHVRQREGQWVGRERERKCACETKREAVGGELSLIHI